jgi:hypothetical protein
MYSFCMECCLTSLVSFIGPISLYTFLYSFHFLHLPTSIFQIRPFNITPIYSRLVKYNLSGMGFEASTTMTIYKIHQTSRDAAMK